MRNENAPRRNLSAQPLRRGSQQAGRLGRAKRKTVLSLAAFNFGRAKDIRALNVPRDAERLF